MKHAMPVVLALLCFTTAADAIIYHSSLLVHPQSGKRALLLDDAHAQWIEKFGSTADKLGHKDLYIEQKKQLNQFGDHLLGLDVQKGSQLVVLTETPDNSYG